MYFLLFGPPGTSLIQFQFCIYGIPSIVELQYPVLEVLVAIRITRFFVRNSYNLRLLQHTLRAHPGQSPKPIMKEIRL